MSHKSNVKKSHLGGLSHHQMKRGLNNWGKGSPSSTRIPKATLQDILKKESAVEILHTVAMEIGPNIRNVPGHELLGDSIGKRSVGRVM